MTEFRTGVISPVECFTEGWALIRDQYWILFGITILGFVIGGVSMYILMGAMLCGIYYCFLQKIDGKNVVLEGLWIGFQKWLPGLVLIILIIVPMIIVYIVIYLPFIAALVMGSKLSAEELTVLFIGAAAIDLVIIVLMTCFHTLLIFSFPLIIDRNLGVRDSITTSAKAVWNNLGGIAGMLGVAMLGSVAAVLLTCGLGAYFLMPIMLAGYAVAYRKIFPALENPNFNPPPPSAFQGAGSYNQIV